MIKKYQMRRRFDIEASKFKETAESAAEIDNWLSQYEYSVDAISHSPAGKTRIRITKEHDDSMTIATSGEFVCINHSKQVFTMTEERLNKRFKEVNEYPKTPRVTEEDLQVLRDELKEVEAAQQRRMKTKNEFQNLTTTIGPLPEKEYDHVVKEIDYPLTDPAWTREKP